FFKNFTNFSSLLLPLTKNFKDWFFLSIYTIKYFHYYSSLTKKNYDLVLIDEGFSHTVYRYFYKNSIYNSKAAKIFIKNFYEKLPVEMVYFQCDPQESVDRVKQRDNIENMNDFLLSIYNEYQP